MTLKYAKHKGGGKKARTRPRQYGGPAAVPGSMPYGFRLRAKLDAQVPTAMPPAFVLDKIAEESVYGPARDRKNPTCGTCFTRKSAAGTCYC